MIITRFSSNLPRVSGFFWKGTNWDTCLQIFFNSPICLAYPRISYICEVPPQPPPTLLVGAPKLFWFHQFMECIVIWEFCNQTMEKKCWKGVPFGKLNLSWNTRVKGTLDWRGTLRVPPQPGCPWVCPPWTHRSYATACHPQHQGCGILTLISCENGTNWEFITK